MEKEKSAKKPAKGFGRLKYKYKVYLVLFAISVTFVILFYAYNFNEYKKQAGAEAKIEAEYTASKIAGSVDERLENLWQYYQYAVTEESVEWLLEHKVDYSDYTYYHKAQEVLGNGKIFGDFINGYTLINYNMNMVLSDKGLYPAIEIVNADDIRELFERGNEKTDKNYWHYNFSGKTPDTLSKNYRKSVDTAGLNIVIKLPSHKFRVYGMLLVNINMSRVQNLIGSFCDSDEEIIVSDRTGKIVFSTNPEYMEYYQKISEGNSKKLEKEGLFVSRSSSSVLGWQFDVIRSIDARTHVYSRFNAYTLIAFLVFISAFFVVIAYLAYHPLDTLLKNVAGETGEAIKGNEIEYIRDRFEGIKYDRQMLEQTVVANKKKIQELFELRLIRGEVRSDDEWNEYFKGLNIAPCRYFASAVMVLNLTGDYSGDNISEDSVCLKIVEEIPEEIKELSWLPLVYNASTMFCIFGDDDESVMLDKIMRFYKGIQGFVEERFGYRILMGISATHTEHRHIYAAYRESINALILSDKGGVSKSGEECRFYLNTMTARVKNFNTSFEKDVQTAIKASDRDQCFFVLDNFSNYIGEIRSNDDAMYLYTRMINAIIEAASETDLELSKLFPDGLRKIYRDVLEAMEPALVRRYLKSQLIDVILSARSNKLEQGSGSIMNKLEELVRKNNGNITLSECARELNVHETYIWKVMKMEKGQSFSEFIEAYKLEEAKRKLLETDNSVSEIAKALGYPDSQIFINAFSKATGLTPGKFRKLS